MPGVTVNGGCCECYKNSFTAHCLASLMWPLSLSHSAAFNCCRNVRVDCLLNRAPTRRPVVPANVCVLMAASCRSHSASGVSYAWGLVKPIPPVGAAHRSCRRIGPQCGMHAATLISSRGRSQRLHTATGQARSHPVKYVCFAQR